MTTGESQAVHPDPVVDGLIEELLSAIDILRDVPISNPGYDSACAMVFARQERLTSALEAWEKNHGPARGALGEPFGTSVCCKGYPHSCDHVWCDTCQGWSKDTGGYPYLNCAHQNGSGT